MTYFPESKRRDWPFKRMEIGEVVEFSADRNKAQVAAHTYGKSSGRSFATASEDGTLYVKRIA